MKNFDYYFSNPTQNYYFNFRTLFSDTFQGLSVSAKALYALMVERANLSNHNNWFDNEKKVYIIYTAAQVIKDFQCSERTALKLLKELTTFGLIERFQNKKGQPYIIYVKLYHSSESTFCDTLADEKSDIPQEVKQKEIQEPKRPLRTEYPNGADYRKAMNQYWNTCDKLEKEMSSKKVVVSPAKNAVTTSKNCSCHQQKIQSSNFNSSHINFSIYSYPSYHNLSKKNVMDREQINKTRDFIKRNINYDVLLHSDFKIHKDELDDIVEIITQVMTSTKATIRIAGEERPTEVVKSVYSKLNMLDIQYVYSCIQETTTKIANIIAYTRTALYNAKRTSNLYYTNLVHYNMMYHWEKEDSRDD